jgi:ABC-2 type transport system permease protein
VTLLDRPAPVAAPPVPLPAGYATLRHGTTLARRNLRHVARIPGRVITSLVQPVMFVLLFAFVFGGSLGGVPYREFLMAGVFAQTMVFNSSFTTLGLANDLQQGIVERLRSLPVNPLALILGRTSSDLVVTAASVVAITVCGLAIGWRIHGSFVDAVLGYALALAFAFAMSWVGATIGLLARSVEVAQSAGLIWFFPMSLISSAFVSVGAMPAPLRMIAQWNPVSAVATTMRDLFANRTPADLAPPPGWPTDHAGLYAVLCIAGILAVFMPLALFRFRRLTTQT